MGWLDDLRYSEKMKWDNYGHIIANTLVLLIIAILSFIAYIERKHPIIEGIFIAATAFVIWESFVKPFLRRLHYDFISAPRDEREERRRKLCKELYGQPYVRLTPEQRLEIDRLMKRHGK